MMLIVVISADVFIRVKGSHYWLSFHTWGRACKPIRLSGPETPHQKFPYDASIRSTTSHCLSRQSFMYVRDSLRKIWGGAHMARGHPILDEGACGQRWNINHSQGHYANVLESSLFTLVVIVITLWYIALLLCEHCLVATKGGSEFPDLEL